MKIHKWICSQSLKWNEAKELEDKEKERNIPAKTLGRRFVEAQLFFVCCIEERTEFDGFVLFTERVEEEPWDNESEEFKSSWKGEKESLI